MQGSAESNGFGYGIHYDHKYFGLVLAGYHGKGLGTFKTMSDGNALDQQGKERNNRGYYGQILAKITDCFKLGAAYGQSRQSKTAFDGTTRSQFMERQGSWNVSAFYNVNRWVFASVGYTKAKTVWMVEPRSQRNQVFSAGFICEW